MAQEEDNTSKPPAGQEELGHPGEPPSPREAFLDILVSLVLIVPAMLAVVVVYLVLRRLLILNLMAIPALIIAFAVTFWCCKKAKPAIVAVLRRMLGKMRL